MSLICGLDRGMNQKSDNVALLYIKNRKKPSSLTFLQYYCNNFKHNLTYNYPEVRLHSTVIIFFSFACVTEEHINIGDSTIRKKREKYLNQQHPSSAQSCRYCFKLRDRSCAGYRVYGTFAR
jgi:hypothetical protein